MSGIYVCMYLFLVAKSKIKSEFMKNRDVTDTDKITEVITNLSIVWQTVRE